VGRNGDDLAHRCDVVLRAVSWESLLIAWIGGSGEMSRGSFVVFYDGLLVMVSFCRARVVKGIYPSQPRNQSRIDGCC
jgi:hypothetical protein